MSFSTTGSVVAGSINAAFNSNTLGNLITTSGNIGIGTTNPAYTLDVNGTINGRSGYTGFTNGIPAVGNIGQFMTTANGYSSTSGSHYYISTTNAPGSSFVQVAVTPPLSNGVYRFGANGYYSQIGSGTASYRVHASFNSTTNWIDYAPYFQSQGVGQYASYAFAGTFNVTGGNTTFSLFSQYDSGGGSQDSANGVWVTRIG